MVGYDLWVIRVLGLGFRLCRVRNSYSPNPSLNITLTLAPVAMLARTFPRRFLDAAAALGLCFDVDAGGYLTL